MSVRFRKISRRVFFALTIGCAAGLTSWLFWRTHEGTSDFAQLWAAARALMSGGNPYDVVGPDKLVRWDFPLLYPLPAVLVAVPFAFLPISAADALFVALGAAAFAWALTQDNDWNAPRLLVFVSIAFFMAIVTSQWSMWITAGALLPSLGFLLACKPTIGLAMFAAYPSRRALAAAAVLIAVSFMVMPEWPAQWLGTLPAATHAKLPITRWEVGGPLLLLALPYWRRPEARLLLALACVPQTPVLYEAIPLFLIVSTLNEGLILVTLTFLLPIGEALAGPYSSYERWMDVRGQLMVALIYLPCLAIMLKQQLSVVSIRRGVLHQRFYWHQRVGSDHERVT